MKKIIIAIFVITSLIVLSGFYVNFKKETNKIEEQITNVENSVKSLDINITEITKDKDKLYETLKKIGVKEAMRLLVEESRGGSNYDCHQESHQIGRIGYEIEKENIFSNCSANCHSGCYHGAMEIFLSEKGTSNLAKNISEICEKFETSFGNFECLHGVGHGILAYLDYNLPEAINECKKLSTSFSQNSCYGGMFMENILTGQGLGANKELNHSTSWVNKTDPYFPCNRIDKDYDLQYQCYQMQTSWMLHLTNYNFVKVIEQCLNIPNNMQKVCFTSFGRDAAGYSLRDPQKILNICDKIPQKNDYYMQCLSGALNVIVDFWGPGLKGQASQLCAITKEPYKGNCYQILAHRLPGLFNEKESQLKICATFEPAYQTLCE